MVDDGARSALVAKGSSLLAIGVVDVSGEFEKGDVVSIVDRENCEFARGLANYNAAETRLVKGLKTDQLRIALEENAVYDEVIHRDNLVILPQ
jgi:glutamate 5-kinase